MTSDRSGMLCYLQKFTNCVQCEECDFLVVVLTLCCPKHLALSARSNKALLPLSLSLLSLMVNGVGARRHKKLRDENDCFARKLARVF